MNNLEKNYSSLCKAIHLVCDKSDNICIPLKTTCSYDFIVEAKGIISRIKVFKTDCRNAHGSCEVKRLKLHPNDCEFIFVESLDGDYFIPSFEVTRKTTITLTKFEKYKIVPG